MDYPIILERDDNDTLLVSFPDFPEAHTFGRTEEDAIEHAVEALATVIDGYIKDRREIPLPSAAIARHRVTLPALTAAKVRLYEIMRQTKTTKSDLARKLAVHLPQVDRLLAVHHGSQLGQLEAAFKVMGKRLVVDVEDIASPRAVVRRRHVGGHGRRSRQTHAR